jgi:hypothetical protein
MAAGTRTATTIRWIARIWGSVSLIFLLFFVGAHLIGTITGKGEPMGRFNSPSEMVSFIFFPVSIMIGLAMAWKWEGLGGLIATVGIIAFYIIRRDLLFNGPITALAAPGLLFLVYWFLTRNRAKAGEVA